MNSFSLTEKFKDQSNYLVAFLASVIGLGAFKDDLSKVHINFFNAEPTLFNLAVPIVIILLISTYLSALTLLIDNVNFTRFPLKGAVSFCANLMGALALAMPLVFLLLWGVSEAVHLVSDRREFLGALAGVTGSVAAVPALLIAIKLTRTGQKRQVQADALNIVVNDRIRTSEQLNVTAPRAQADEPEFEFLKRYEEVSKFIKDYLDVNGYSVKDSKLVHMVRTLIKKGVMDERDLKVARGLADLRTAYASGSRDRMQTRVKTGIQQLDAIHEKVSNAFWALITDQDDSVTNDAA